MGSRDAQCYLASPEVVAASAVAGYIRGPHEFADRNPERRYSELSASSGAPAEKVEILKGFPERVKGRLVFMPQDNVNTDAIYGKDYTYRDDMTKEMMAKIVMENYDPQFAANTKTGDVIVSGFNFGTGSSREQAVTCLKAKGIPLVIAASFSQTYLRNAYNNGFLCVEVPALVNRLREQFAKEIAAKEKTVIPGDEIDIDFTNSAITWRGEKFPFPALGSVPQSLVIAEGVENLVAKRLGLAS
jgi:homoaconitate hydratase